MYEYHTCNNSEAQYQVMYQIVKTEEIMNQSNLVVLAQYWTIQNILDDTFPVAEEFKFCPFCGDKLEMEK